MKESIKRLEFLCKTLPSLLENIEEEIFLYKPEIEKWSKKQILGHLIDSATNNHHRFVRGQFEKCPIIFYEQNLWNGYNYYQQIETRQLIEFWKVYNIQICELIKRIPNENLTFRYRSEFSIEYLFIDYVVHLEHHLKQLVNYT